MAVLKAKEDASQGDSAWHDWAQRRLVIEADVLRQQLSDVVALKDQQGRELKAQETELLKLSKLGMRADCVVQHSG